MVAARLILANAPAPVPAPGPVGRGLLDYDLLWTLLALAVVIAAGTVLIALVNRWRMREDQDDATGDQMVGFRQLYERGELSQEEYDRIKERLTRRLRQDLNLPGPNKPESPLQPPTPPTPPVPPGSPPANNGPA